MIVFGPAVDPRDMRKSLTLAVATAAGTLSAFAGPAAAAATHSAAHPHPTTRSARARHDWPVAEIALGSHVRGAMDPVAHITLIPHAGAKGPIARIALVRHVHRGHRHGGFGALGSRTVAFG